MTGAAPSPPHAAPRLTHTPNPLTPHACKRTVIRQQGGKEGKTRVNQLLEWATNNDTEEFNGCVLVYL